MRLIFFKNAKIIHIFLLRKFKIQGFHKWVVPFLNISALMTSSSGPWVTEEEDDLACFYECARRWS